MKISSSIEPLESRIAPAGIVTATLAAGKLTLAGDADANDLSLAVTAPGHYELTGGGTTTIVFGGGAAAAAVAFDGVVTELVSDLGGGSDSLVVDRLALSKGITVTDSAGDNVYEFNNTAAGGAITFTLGAGDDSVSFGGFTASAARALTVALGDGANSLTIGANTSQFGSVSVTGGTGIDTLDLPGGDATIAGALVANLGEEANVATINSASLRVGGNLTISHGAHAAGTALTTFSNGEVDVKGATLLSFVDGDNQINLNSRLAIFRGLLTIQGGANSDAIVYSGAELQGLGGVKVLGGEGDNSLNLSGSSRTLKSLNYTGGSGVDLIFLGGTTATVTGATTLSLGAGANNLSGGPTVANYFGAVKVTGGADDDSLSLSGASVRLAKGATIDGGTGTNVTRLDGDVVWSSGAITFLNGNHVVGTSQALVGGNYVRLDAGVTAKFADGSREFSLSPGLQALVKGNVTVSAPGSGNTTVNLNSQVLAVSGRVAVTGGSGGTALAILGNSARIGSVQFVDGAGDAFVNIQTDGTITGLTSLDLGTGGDSVNIFGASAGLTLKAGLKVLSKSGNANNESVSLRNLTLVGATKLTLGDAASVVDVRDVIAGAFTLDAGAGSDFITVETNDDTIVSVFNGPAAFILGSGTNVLTIGANTALAKANFKGTMKVVGGSETDTFTDNGNIFIANQPVVTGVP